MTPDESALAVLVQEADWGALRARMEANNFHGEIIVSELVDEHLAEVEKLAENEEVVESVPEEIEIKESAE
jgi:hypothetical protein